MHDSFTLRVQAAAVATWWTVLCAVLFATVLWTVYLLLLSCRPVWMLALWGPDVGWATVQQVCLYAIVAFKFIVWLLALAALWLTLWARHLKKHPTGN